MANDYEAKQEARRERYEERAAKAKAKSDGAFESAHQIADGIPMGQPILVGHHSEKRARRDQDRIHNGMRRGVDEMKKAEHYERKADSVGTGGISSDDPDAVVKLREKLADMESKRAEMKARNAAWRKAGKPGPDGQPFARYELTNLGANIRRVKGRIETLEKQSARTDVEEYVEGIGWTMEENRADNRVRFEFDSKPDADTRTMLKRHGFRWAPSVSAWQRMATRSGMYAANDVVACLHKTTEV